MAQIIKKGIQDNAVGAAKIRLENDSAFRARNAADSGDVEILRVNGSDEIVFASVPQVSSDPVAANDLARKAYVDAIAQGIKPKAAVRAATTGNTSLSGLSTIDGVSLLAGDRVLVKDQTLPAENGIYVAAAGAWARSSDFDSVTPIDEINGAYTFVQEGTDNGGKAYIQTGTVTTIGTDPIVFELFNTVGDLSAGDGIDISLGQISVALATDSGLEFSSGDLRVDAFQGLERTASGLSVKLEASNPSLAFFGGSTDELGVRLNSDSALTKTATGLQVTVDAATVKRNGSNQLESLKQREEKITLTGTDITNQYVDLSFAVYGTSASLNSIQLSVKGLPIQEKGVDYTVGLTAGTGGVTRITFAGDLATGGPAALVTGDILMLTYSYLT